MVGKTRPLTTAGIRPTIFADLIQDISAFPAILGHPMPYTPSNRSCRIVRTLPPRSKCWLKGASDPNMQTSILLRRFSVTCVRFCFRIYWSTVAFNINVFALWLLFILPIHPFSLLLCPRISLISNYMFTRINRTSSWCFIRKVNIQFFHHRPRRQTYSRLDSIVREVGGTSQIVFQIERITGLWPILTPIL